MFVSVDIPVTWIYIQSLRIAVAIGPDRWMSIFTISKGVVGRNRSVSVDAYNLSHQVIGVLRSFAILKSVPGGHE